METLSRRSRIEDWEGPHPVNLCSRSRYAVGRAVLRRRLGHLFRFRTRTRIWIFRALKRRLALKMKTLRAHPDVEVKLLSNVCSTKQAPLNDQEGRARALNSVKLLQASILCPEDEEDYTTTWQHRRPASPDQYTLAMDDTAAKMVTAVIDKCKLFQCLSSVFKEESYKLLSALTGLHNILQTIARCPCLTRYLEALEDIMLYSTKAYAFLEKLCFKVLPNSTHGLSKARTNMCEFACRFSNLTVRLSEDLKQSQDDDGNLISDVSPREERLSFGVTTYTVPIHNVAEKLLRRKRVSIPLTDLEGTSEYNVELSCPRFLRWFSKDLPISARIEGHRRGFSQTLNAGRVKIEKGSWGWEEAQDTVLITYNDLVVANVASEKGRLLTYNKHYSSSQHSPVLKVSTAQNYRTSIQIVGSSRIDIDLQNLFIKGVKDKDHVYYKCFVNTTGREEVLGVYRFQQKQLHMPEGSLQIVGRGNQPGLRHVLVSIFASLGFTPAV